MECGRPLVGGRAGGRGGRSGGRAGGRARTQAAVEARAEFAEQRALRVAVLEIESERQAKLAAERLQAAAKRCVWLQ